jgi:hypothetical protein
MKKKEVWFTQKEILELFQIHRQTLNRWRRQKLIKYKKCNKRVFYYTLPKNRKTAREKEISLVKMANNSAYKSWHKPNMNEATAKTKQGYYKITNKEKYVGDPNLCIYRSSWEFAFCKYCDYSPSIKRWSAEPISIPYYDRTAKLEENAKLGLDNNNPSNWKVSNYHVDFWIEQDRGEDKTEKIFIEIKPAYKLKRPVPPREGAPLKEEKRYVHAAKEYLQNESKWAACKSWAEKNDAKFYVFTEDTLKNILARFNQ